MEKVIDHFLYALDLHENNAIVVYSPTLADQIPMSHAANAFMIFQQALHQLELIRLCALWDTPAIDNECIPTVIELIDHPDVMAALVQETRSQHASVQPAILKPESDREIVNLMADAIKQENERFANEQAAHARLQLSEAITEARSIMVSDKLKSLMNLRHKLAHATSQTRQEKKAASQIAPVRYGDEREILTATCPLVEKLYCWINGTSFSVADSREIDRQNAHALWGGCRFDVLC